MAQIKTLKFNDHVVAKTYSGDASIYLFDGKIIGNNGIEITGGFNFSSPGDYRATITTGSGGMEIRQDGGDIVFIGENTDPSVKFFNTEFDLRATSLEESCGVLVKLLQYVNGNQSLDTYASPFRLVVSQSTVTDNCGLSSGYVVFAVPAY